MFIRMGGNNLFKQLFKFAVVGVIAALIDVGVLVLLKELLFVPVLIASALSFTASVIVNYLLSMTFVFKSKGENKVKEFIIFVLLSIGGLGLNQFILWLGVTFTSTYYLIVKILAMVIVPIYNFLTRKIFLEKKEK